VKIIEHVEYKAIYLWTRVPGLGQDNCGLEMQKEFIVKYTTVSND
jgi:hypothetical protein